jgi:hypothetical protein
MPIKISHINNGIKPPNEGKLNARLINKTIIQVGQTKAAIIRQ